MKAEYPHGEQQSSTHQMNRPFDKQSDPVHSTSIHPHSEIKNTQRNYHYVNERNAEELKAPREVAMYGSDFHSTLPQHPPAEKQTHFQTIYNDSFNK
jgi:hypothetical protein